MLLIGGLASFLAVQPAAAAPRQDLIVNPPVAGRVDLLRPAKQTRIPSSSLHFRPFQRTGKTPVELWAHRPEPGQPAVVETINRSSGKPVGQLVPGLTATMDRGLNDFLRIRIRDAKGRTVIDRLDSYCPTGLTGGSLSASVSGRSGSGARARGPIPIYPHSDYEEFCGEEQADSLVWMSGPRDPVYFFGSGSFNLPDGDYTYEVTLNPAGILPEKTLANNRYIQKFSVKTSRRLWRRATGSFGNGPRAGTARTSSSTRGRRLNAGRFRVKPPTVKQIDGPDGGLPDPAALPASKFGFDRRGSRAEISFSSIVANLGDAPIALYGSRTQRKSKTMPGWQFLKGEDGELVRRQVNGFVWDQRDTHIHWHYNKLAVYELLSSSGKVVRRSGKVGFCFMATTALRFNPVPGRFGMSTPYFPESSGLSASCGSRGSKQVGMSLEAGWGDEYFQGVAGQSLDVTDLPAGEYRLRITVNPQGDLAETTADNNVAERLIELRGSGADRSLVVPQQGIVSKEFHRLRSSSGRFRIAGASIAAAGTSGYSPNLLCGLRQP